MKLSAKEYILLSLFILGGLAMIAGPYWSSIERGVALKHFGLLGSHESIDAMKTSIAVFSSSLRRAQYGLSIGALGAVLLVICITGLWYDLRKQVGSITKDQI